MIKVAVLGVGNCASSLIQGVHLYSKQEGNIGLMHPTIRGYKVSDINFVAAFDVDANKVGKDLSEAVYSLPNNTIKLCDVPNTGVVVERGMVHDGIAKHMHIKKSSGPTSNIKKILQDRGVDIVVNYLPVGSEEATKWYAEQVIAAGCAFINAIPVFMASDKTRYWPKRFADANLPILGDDIKSQVGATIVNRVLARLFEDRGCVIDRMYQLNFGGNSDFENMLDRSRLFNKKISKTNSVQAQLCTALEEENIHVGPSDHIPWLQDRKWCHIRIEGRNFGGAPINLELKLEVWDSPNSAGVMIDAIRCAKIALDRKLVGAVEIPSAYFFKTPPAHNEVGDFEIRGLLDEWIAR